MTPPSAAPRKRVLVVEDHDSVRSLLKAVLSREGIDIEEAPNGRVAIEKLAASSFDAVVLDLMMPIVSGYKVLDYLKANAPQTHCIVVTAAGEIGLSSIDPSIEVLKKPFDTDELRRRVLAAIGNASMRL